MCSLIVWFIIESKNRLFANRFAQTYVYRVPLVLSIIKWTHWNAPNVPKEMWRCVSQSERDGLEWSSEWTLIIGFKNKLLQIVLQFLVSKKHFDLSEMFASQDTKITRLYTLENANAKIQVINKWWSVEMKTSGIFFATLMWKWIASAIAKRFWCIFRLAQK